MRHILYHRHIFKNGGQSLEKMLHLSFGDRFLRSEAAPEELRQILQANKNICAVSGHNLRPFVLPDVFSHSLVMLRDPFERLVSIWRYLALKKPVPKDMEVLPTNAGLHHFLHSMIKNTPWHIYDHQLSFLANRTGPWTRPVADDLSRVKSFLPIHEGLGTIDLWEESLRTSEKRLSQSFPELVLFTLHRDNASAVEVLNRDQARKMVRDVCGWRFYSDLYRAVEGDLALVESARQEVWRRMADLDLTTNLGRFSQPDWGFHFRTTCEKHLAAVVKDKPIRMLEIGVFEGRGMCWAFEHLLRHPQSSYVGCDPWYWEAYTNHRHTWSDIERVAFANASLFYPRSRLVKGTLTDALKVAPGPYDFIYIDGDHSAESCFSDSETGWSVLNPGGWMLWDDVGTKSEHTDWPGVAAGMVRFLTRHQGEFEYLQEGYQVLIQKNIT